MTDRTCRTARRRGFTLPEVLVALAILAVASLVALRATQTVARIYYDAPVETARLATQQRLIDSLTNDVWSAETLEATATRLSLAGPLGPIVWTLSPDGTLSRESPEVPTLSAPDLFTKSSFAVNGPTLTLATPDGPFTFVSERRRLGATGRNSP